MFKNKHVLKQHNKHVSKQTTNMFQNKLQISFKTNKKNVLKIFLINFFILIRYLRKFKSLALF